jgi:hypothetical protein
MLFLVYSQEATGIKPREQRLVYGGIQLAPSAKLSDYGVEPGTESEHVLQDVWIVENCVHILLVSR